MARLYLAGVLLEEQTQGVSGGASMIHQYDFDTLFLMPFGFAIAFMVWVFWNLTKQIKR